MWCRPVVYRKERRNDDFVSVRRSGPELFLSAHRLIRCLESRGVVGRAPRVDRLDSPLLTHGDTTITSAGHPAVGSHPICQPDGSRPGRSHSVVTFGFSRNWHIPRRWHRVENSRSQNSGRKDGGSSSTGRHKNDPIRGQVVRRADCCDSTEPPVWRGRVAES